MIQSFPNLFISLAVTWSSLTLYVSQMVLSWAIVFYPTSSPDGTTGMNSACEQAGSFSLFLSCVGRVYQSRRSVAAAPRGGVAWRPGLVGASFWPRSPSFHSLIKQITRPPGKGDTWFGRTVRAYNMCPFQLLFSMSSVMDGLQYKDTVLVFATDVMKLSQGPSQCAVSSICNQIAQHRVQSPSTGTNG